MLDPDDIMGSIIFLLSDTSKYINGQNLIVDDGWSLQFMHEKIKVENKWNYENGFYLTAEKSRIGKFFPQSCEG